MLGTFAFLLTVQLAYSQDYSHIPDDCQKLPPGVTNPLGCCEVPPLFSAEELEACGIAVTRDENGQILPPQCEASQCVLQRLSLARDDGVLDLRAIKAYTEQWASQHPEFTDAVNQANGACLAYPVPGPPELCEPNKLAFCFSSHLHMNCPTWKDSDECRILKQHTETCQQYFRSG